MTSAKVARRVRTLVCVLALTVLGYGCNDDDDGAADTGTGDAADVSDSRDGGGDSDSDSRDGGGDSSGSVCGDELCEVGEDCEADCALVAILLHDQLSGGLYSFPDDFFTVEDPTTVTGLRVDMTEDRLSEIGEQPAPLDEVFGDMNTLDGFGTTAGAYFRFTRPLDADSVPSGEETALNTSPIIFGWFDSAGALQRVPVETIVVRGSSSLILRPMIPLPPNTQAVAAFTDAILSDNGHPVVRSVAMDAVLNGTADPVLDAIQARVADAIVAFEDAGAILGAGEIAGITVFTTQSTWNESAAIADEIRIREHVIATNEGCAETSRWKECVLTFAAGEYRDSNGHIIDYDGRGPAGDYALRVQVYLPLQAGEFGGPPYPTMIFGHGLTGDRRQAEELARHAAPLGIATVSIDAPAHGEHPGGGSSEVLEVLQQFFGLTLGSPLGFDSLILRDNWRQSTYDKLALVDLITSGIDVDQDDAIDLDPNRLTYLGASLGAIMGPELLALSEEISAAVLTVGGARVIDIVQFSETFTPLIMIARPPGVDDGELARFWVLLQTVIERGDGGNYGPHVLQDRLVQSDPPDVLAGMAIDDDTVPEPTNFFLARALGLPHISTVIRKIGVVPEQAAPVSNNIGEGVTAGILQFDYIQKNGTWREAGHSSTPSSDQGIEAWLHFLETHFEGDAEIIDPYLTLGTPPPER